MSQGVSLKPTTYIEGTGLIDDVDVIIKEASFAMFDYNGRLPAVPAAKLILDEGDGVETIQYYSVGKASDWMPSEDGKSLTAIGKATALVKSSNWAVFVTALVNAGFPENKIENDISIFNGMEGHVSRVAAPERKGLKKEKKDYEDTILVFDKLHKLPWEKPKKKSGPPSGAGVGTTTTSTKKKDSKKKEESGSNVEEKATEFILEILSQNPDGIEKNKLPTLAFKLRKDDPDRNGLVKMVFEDAFLSSVPLWKFENGKILPLET